MESLVLSIDLYEIFDNTFFYLTFLIAVAGLLAMFSKSFAFSLYSAFVAFTDITMKTNYEFYTNLLMVIMVIILMITSFQIYGKTKGESGGVEA